MPNLLLLFLLTVWASQGYKSRRAKSFAREIQCEVCQIWVHRTCRQYNQLLPNAKRNEQVINEEIYPEGCTYNGLKDYNEGFPLHELTVQCEFMTDELDLEEKFISAVFEKSKDDKQPMDELKLRKRFCGRKCKKNGGLWTRDTHPDTRPSLIVKSQVEGDAYLSGWNVGTRQHIPGNKEVFYVEKKKPPKNAKRCVATPCQLNFKLSIVNLVGKGVTNPYDGVTFTNKLGIPAIAEAVPHMPEGAVWEMFVPSQHSFGDTPNIKNFVPGAALIMTAEVVEWIDTGEERQFVEAMTKAAPETPKNEL